MRLRQKLHPVAGRKRRVKGGLGSPVDPHLSPGQQPLDLVASLAGQLLPALISGALGIMLYGMFLAIIVPPARRERGVLVAVLSAVALSCLFRYLPFLSFVSSGFALIISAVVGACVAALLFPVDAPADETGEPDAGCAPGQEVRQE